MRLLPLGKYEYKEVFFELQDIKTPSAKCLYILGRKQVSQYECAKVLIRISAQFLEAEKNNDV